MIVYTGAGTSRASTAGEIQKSTKQNQSDRVIEAKLTQQNIHTAKIIINYSLYVGELAENN